MPMTTMVWGTTIITPIPTPHTIMNMKDLTTMANTIMTMVTKVHLKNTLTK